MTDLLDDVDKMNDPKMMMDYVLEELKFENESSEWLEDRVKVIDELQDSKYEKCANFREPLLRTGDSTIVESTKDSYWASGLPGIAITKNTSQDKWPGKNLLGKSIDVIERQEKGRPEKGRTSNFYNQPGQICVSLGTRM